MPPKQLPPGQATNGTINSVPCPHCSKPNDFRALHEQQLLDTGSSASCDHCGGNMAVVRIMPTTIIWVRKAPPSSINRGVNAQPAAPARAVAPSVLQKLLGRGKR